MIRTVGRPLLLISLLACGVRIAAQDEREELLARLQRARQELTETLVAAEAERRADRDEAEASTRRLERLRTDRAAVTRDLSRARAEIETLAERQRVASSGPARDDVLSLRRRTIAVTSALSARLARILDRTDPRRTRLRSSLELENVSDAATILDAASELMELLADECTSLARIELLPTARIRGDRRLHGFDLRVGWVAWAFVAEDGSICDLMHGEQEPQSLDRGGSSALAEAVALLRKRITPRFIAFPYPKVSR